MADFHSAKVANTVCAKTGHRISAVPVDGPPTLLRGLGITVQPLSRICTQCGYSLKSILGRAAENSTPRKSAQKEGENGNSE